MYYFRFFGDRMLKGNFKKFYDVFIIIIVFISLIPIMTKSHSSFINNIDKLSVIVLIIDFFVCWINHYNINKNSGFLNKIKYPFTFLGITDILSILPSLKLIPPEFKVLLILRVLKLIKKLSIIKFIIRVLKRQQKILLGFFAIVAIYILISALIMFNFEPSMFKDFLAALYWSTTALTTTGYGDIYPITNVGRIISMLSSFVGIAVIAFPAGIINIGIAEETDSSSKTKVY